MFEIKGGIGVLTRGTILATGTAADIGKLVKLTAGNGSPGVWRACSILRSTLPLPFSDGSVTGSIAKAGSFRGPALIVPAGSRRWLDLGGASWAWHLCRRADHGAGGSGCERVRGTRRRCPSLASVWSLMAVTGEPVRMFHRRNCLPLLSNMWSRLTIATPRSLLSLHPHPSDR